VANLAAFSALAYAVVRDADLRDDAARAAEEQVRELVADRVAAIFVSWFSDIDFDLESLLGRHDPAFDRGPRVRDVLDHIDFAGLEQAAGLDAGSGSALRQALEGLDLEALEQQLGWRPRGGLRLRELLNERYWSYARDAYITNRPQRVGGGIIPGSIQLNPLGAPDAESESLRPRALELVEAAYREGVEQRDGSLLAIPLYSARTGRDPVGAAYVRVDVPGVPRPGVDLDVPFVAASMGGATLAAVGFVFLLMHVLVLRPLEDISAGARAVSAGQLDRPVPATGRRDEIDTLIATFNGMTAEIREKRLEQEQRVEEAVERMRATERRLVLSERLAAMGTMAAGIAHEINNPLGGMQNALHSIESGALPEETERRYLRLLGDGLGRIRTVVQRVLRFAPRRVPPGPIPLAQILEDATGFVQHRVQERRLGVAVEVEPGLRVRGDAAALGQVFLNLLLNSIDACEPGRGSIRVTAAAVAGSVRVRVADDGKGMTAAERERAFDLFFTTKEAGAGTGLGLSIAHQIVAEHGGTMEIESAPGEGTAVIVVLPAA
jgi:signal transduction histidine kinase